MQVVGTIVCKAEDGTSKAGGEDGTQKEEEPLFMRYVKNMPLDYNDPTYLEKAYGTGVKEQKPASPQAPPKAALEEKKSAPKRKEAETSKIPAELVRMSNEMI